MDLKQEDIFIRIKEVMGFKFEKELSEFLGMSPQSLGTVKKRGTIPFEKIIEKSIGNYNLEYIFFGKGRTTPPKFDLENEPVIDYELLNLVTTYAPPKMKEELKEKLLKLKEFQESL
ncbi:helix-turn-helix domain-containing protein [Aliarcobacter butzleri]|uniref:helix-turn-helix domain-containing protein n=1 Tax=Aliarcobacter butzleri TaxID=28197 RepID=UPI00125FFC27|nr:helix-turn-helix domain-containing protein [Aliarcobacter butzleri]